MVHERECSDHNHMHSSTNDEAVTKLFQQTGPDQ